MAESTRARIREGLYPSHAGDVPHVTVYDGRWLLAEVDRLLAASSERSDPPKDDRTFGTDYPNLKGRCPACHNETLFRGSKGYITCSWLKCPNPGAVVDLLEATSAERLAVVPPVGTGPQNTPEQERADEHWKLQGTSPLVIGEQHTGSKASCQHPYCLSEKAQRTGMGRDHSAAPRRNPSSVETDRPEVTQCAETESITPVVSAVRAGVQKDAEIYFLAIAGDGPIGQVLIGRDAVRAALDDDQREESAARWDDFCDCDGHWSFAAGVPFAYEERGEDFSLSITIVTAPLPAVVPSVGRMVVLPKDCPITPSACLWPVCGTDSACRQLQIADDPPPQQVNTPLGPVTVNRERLRWERVDRPQDDSDNKGEQMKQEAGEMHWSDNWMFKRLEDGSVRIRKSVGTMTVDGVEQPIITTATIPPMEWASLIHHLGKEQTAEAMKQAVEFHGVGDR